jgi:hypothetical protein
MAVNLFGGLLFFAVCGFFLYLHAFQYRAKKQFIAIVENFTDRLPAKGKAKFSHSGNMSFKVGERELEIQIDKHYYGRGLYYNVASFFIPLEANPPKLRIARKSHAGFRLKQSSFSLENPSLEDLDVWADEPEKARRTLVKKVQGEIFALGLRLGESILLDEDGLTLQLDGLVSDEDRLRLIVGKLMNIAELIDRSQ